MLCTLLLSELICAEDAANVWAGTQWGGWKRKVATTGKHVGRVYLVDPSDKKNKIWEVTTARLL